VTMAQYGNPGLYFDQTLFSSGQVDAARKKE
jgi:hypothetical protein